jgi:hypothetical protein
MGCLGWWYYVHDVEVAAEASLAGELCVLTMCLAVFPCEVGVGATAGESGDK